MPASPDIGGQGMPALVCSAVAEMWKSANLSFSLCQMFTLGAVQAITHHASAELQQRYLPKMVAGAWTGTMNLTEPEADPTCPPCARGPSRAATAITCSVPRYLSPGANTMSPRTSSISCSRDCRTRLRVRMLAQYDSSPREAAAGAVPYLKLTGTVAGGWQMVRAARIAHHLLASSEENAAFLRGKIAAARFYAEHVLPEAETWRDEITLGATSTLALEEALF